MTTTRGKRRVLWFVAIAACLVAIVARNAAKWLVVDAPERADVIVVLAGETDRRPARALELFQQGYARKIVLDVPAGMKIYDFTQLQLAQSYVERRPERDAMTICPIEGLSTRDEARDAARCLDGASSVLVVTSDFHTRRAISIFRRELQGKSVSVAAAHNDAQFGARWWTQRQWAKTAVDEWLRLLWWDAIERWQ